MKLIDQIAEILIESKKALHVDDIALLITEKYPNLQIALDKLPGRISGTLSSDIKKNKQKSIFSRPKNKQGGYRKGVYKVKATRKKKVAKVEVPDQPKVSTGYTGKAGEHAVLSELLFFGFNASIMTVDDGIDIVASKDNNYFHIQVKTANPSLKGRYGFTLQQKSFDAKDAASTFYIFVLRFSGTERHYNEYLILPNSEIRRLIDRGILKKAERISLRVERDTSGSFLLNGDERIDWALNRFDTIK